MNPTDPLSDLLHRGDPASDVPEVRPTRERSAALLARCASDTPHTAYEAVRPPLRKMRKRWMLPLLAGGVTTSVAFGVAVWLGCFAPPVHRSAPPLAESTPRPAPLPIAPIKAMGGSGQKKATEPVKLVKSVKPVKLLKPVARQTALGAPALRRHVFRDDVQTAEVKSPVRRHNHAPTTAPVVPSPEPVVQSAPRIIIVQDDTPVQAEPPFAPSVSIVMTSHSESVIVSHAAASPAKL